MVAEKKDKRVKGFKLDDETHKLVEDLIDKSGKESVEWFEEVIQKLATNELVLEKESISPQLRKHFTSDVAAIKEATTLITSIFLNQMNRISVEKTNWNDHLNKVIRSHEDVQENQKEKIRLLEEALENKDSDMTELNQQMMSLNSKVISFEKLEEELRKNIDRLEIDKAKAESEIASLKESNSDEKRQYIEALEEMKFSHKEEKDRLNQQIVDAFERLKEMEPILKENTQLKDSLKELQAELLRKSQQYELNLTRNQEQAEIDKQKALLERERELNTQSRHDMRELYEKIEGQQQRVQELTIENNSLRKQ